MDGSDQSQYAGSATQSCPQGNCSLKLSYDGFNPEELHLSNGPHTINVFATDAANNSSRTTWTVSTTQDRGSCPSDAPRFTTYNAGASLAGLLMTNAHRTCEKSNAPGEVRTDDVTYSYGSCDASGGSCMPPVEVQSAPLCERHAALYSPTDADGEPYPVTSLTIRGVPAASYENGTIVEIYAGDTTITVRAQPTGLVQAFLGSLNVAVIRDIPQTLNDVLGQLPSLTASVVNSLPLPLPDPTILTSPTPC